MISLLYETNNMYRNYIDRGSLVSIVLKKDQGTNKRIVGKVKDIFTSKPFHSRGIKVRLIDGSVGRIQKILN